ncbi:MAG: DDE-type integrase/transposase/recombinase [Acidobacteria bacterium]|nr:DDE-type integrase/transposase/recombinase [Acidobacteriota bacterium]
MPIMTADQYQQWLDQNNVSQQTKMIINQIRSSEPSRRVRGGKSNVIGAYPSRKMGLTIQFESHKNELPILYQYEYSSDVLEYYDQPPAIKLRYEAANGKNIGPLHTPDFFVIREDCAGYEECKTEEELEKLSEKSPNRYYKDENGEYRCPPGEAYAEEHGLYYQVVSSKTINWNVQRNLEFLGDYLHSNAPQVKSAIAQMTLALINSKQGMLLNELFNLTTGNASVDDIYMLIATQTVFVDLAEAPLTQSDRVKVFTDAETARLFQGVIQYRAISEIPKYVDLAIGGQLQWDGQGMRVLNVGETMIGVLHERNGFTEIPIAVFEDLVQNGRFKGVPSDNKTSIHPDAVKKLLIAGEAALTQANQRSAFIKTYQTDKSSINEGPVGKRTMQRLLKQQREADVLYGYGLIGLLPKTNRGNTMKKLPSNAHEKLDEFIRDKYETIKQQKKFESYAQYQNYCENEGVLAASYKTFTTKVKERPAYEQTKKRQGRRAAYEHKPFYHELEQTTPRHGERPFHIAHIDHTQADVELSDPETGENLGRPWVTFMIDAYSRRLLAVYITFDEPSYRSNMMVIRECVRRFGRLPQIVVVDGGTDFSGIYFDLLLALFDCTKKVRPAAEPRFGSVCERLFGTANTQFFHNLQGNTQIMRLVRQVTKSVNPKNHSIWTLELLYRYLREWAYEIYDNLVHRALDQSPRETFAAGMKIGGERLHRLIPYDEQFKMLTLPSTKSGVAKVVPSRGIKVRNIYYWSESLRTLGLQGKNVKVRYDPFDAGHLFVATESDWIECFSEYYADFKNRSEKEILIASEELRERKSQTNKKFNITAAKLAAFLKSVDSQEALLKQRDRDREQRTILSLVNAGETTHKPDRVASPSAGSTHLQPVAAVAQDEAPALSQQLSTYGGF